MKKRLLGIIVALFLCVSASSVSTASAASDKAAGIAINIDGQMIATDVKPEIKNNRLMVPVRVISEHLGATVKYANSKVSISKDELNVTLALNSDFAEVNGKKLRLDVKPYAKNNRTFVPLRFIAEVFEGKVGYVKGTVTVNTPPLNIEGKAVKALQWEFRMTMGGMIQQSASNVYNEAVYRVVKEHIGEEIEAPEHYSWSYFMDEPGAYYKNIQYEFHDAKENIVARYDVYSLVTTVPAELIEGYPETIIHDAVDNKWYLYDNAALEEVGDILNKAQQSGYVILVSNTIV